MSLLRPMAVWALAHSPNEVYALIGEQSSRFWAEWDKWMAVAMAPVLSRPEPYVPPDPGPAPALLPHPGEALQVSRQSDGSLRSRIRTGASGADSLYPTRDAAEPSATTLAWRAALAAWETSAAEYQRWQQARHARSQGQAAHTAWAAERSAAQRWARALKA